MTTFEVRRGSAVVTRKDNADTAIAFAAVHSHFPGQLRVWCIEHREYEIAQPGVPVPIKGAAGLRAGRR